MFGIGFPELIVILVIVLIVFGPNKLPDLAKGLGKGLAEFRKATQEIKDSLNLDEEINDLKNQTIDSISEFKNAFDYNDDNSDEEHQDAEAVETNEEAETAETSEKVETAETVEPMETAKRAGASEKAEKVKTAETSEAAEPAEKVETGETVKKVETADKNKNIDKKDEESAKKETGADE